MVQNDYVTRIKAEIDRMAMEDEALASALKKDNKSWDEFGTWLYQEVTRMKSAADKIVMLEDELVYNMAKEYWMNDKIIVSKAPSVSKPAEKSAEQKKKEAEKKAADEAKRKKEDQIRKMQEHDLFAMDENQDKTDEPDCQDEQESTPDDEDDFDDIDNISE